MSEQMQGGAAAGSDEYLRFVGVAIATAAADGEINPQERRIIDTICEQVGLDEAQRARVEVMLQGPPDAAQIARWTSGDDRIAVYAIGLMVAQADDKMRLQETRVLDRLRRFLKLTPDEIVRAEYKASEGHL